MKLENVKTGFMGTIEFDAKFPGMRKAQNFSVYPMHEEGESDKIIRCQSDSRWLEINSETGECEITTAQQGHHSGIMLAYQKAARKHKEFTLPEVELSHLKMQIFTTQGKEVGNSVARTDNSGAVNIL